MIYGWSCIFCWNFRSSTKSLIKLSKVTMLNFSQEYFIDRGIFEEILKDFSWKKASPFFAVGLVNFPKSGNIDTPACCVVEELLNFDLVIFRPFAVSDE